MALWNIVFPGDPPWNNPAQVIKRKLHRQRDLFLVGIVDSAVIATVLGGYDGFRGWIYHLAVHPDYRKRGFGHRLMEEIEKVIFEAGAIKINLQIRAHNSEVIRFYEGVGYRTENHISMGKHL